MPKIFENFMRTRIISAFPGTGKSTYYENHKESCIDSDSSNFSWIYRKGQKIRNPEFPENYIKHIKENIGKYKFIFVSSHKEVRDALLGNCLFFYLAYPFINRKEEFIKRYNERGSDKKFIELLDKNWSAWINEIESIHAGCRKIEMHAPNNLEDEINKIIENEK